MLTHLTRLLFSQIFGKYLHTWVAFFLQTNMRQIRKISQIWDKYLPWHLRSAAGYRHPVLPIPQNRSPTSKPLPLSSAPSWGKIKVNLFFFWQKLQPFWLADKLYRGQSVRHTFLAYIYVSRLPMGGSGTTCFSNGTPVSHPGALHLTRAKPR